MIYIILQIIIIIIISVIYKYSNLIKLLFEDVNESWRFLSQNPNPYAIRILEQNNPTNQQQEWSNLIEHCRKWDSVYKLDGLSLYPELAEIFKKHGY